MLRVTQDTKIQCLKRAPLFAEMSKRELVEVARLADDLHVEAGDVLAREGEIGHEFFVVVEGEVEVRRNGRLVRKLTAGDFFGEIALVADVPRTATVTAPGAVRVLVMTARDFRTLMKELPSLQPKVIYALAMRLPPEFQ